MGRVPNLKKLNLHKIGIKQNEGGFIKVDKMFRTNVKNIFAIGDIIDKVQLTPVAIAEAVWLIDNHNKKTFKNFDYKNIPTAVFSNPNFASIGLSENDVKKAIEQNIKPEFNWTVAKVTSDDVAQLLADGDVVARFGIESMEFGARALGNRSIIADPRRPDVIHHINKLVKMRDFWMPFAPSILAERENDYMINPKGIDTRFMAIGCDSTDLAKDHLPAGLHPFDKSARPQVVHQKDNPGYHELIKAFESLTGVGAVMNTSFNIHGEPIVGTPDQAIDTFKRCGLHHLLIGDWLISKEK